MLCQPWTSRLSAISRAVGRNSWKFLWAGGQPEPIATIAHKRDDEEVHDREPGRTVRSARAAKSRGEDPTCHDERVSDDLVSVLWTSSLVEAEIAKGRLEAESIPVQLIGEGADDPFPVGPAELLVPSRFEEEARRILAQSENGSDRS
jgi:hypothetical protein